MNRGNYSLTYTGKRFYPLDPRPEDIDIVDIAHALSHICRFGGHVKEFYSVAQHSVHVMQVLEWREAVQDQSMCGYANCKETQLWGLLHDASEAYIGDVVTPLKSELSQYKIIEERVMLAITQKFGLWPDEPTNVRNVDRRLCLTEARDLLPAANDFYVPQGWGDLRPFSFKVVPWTQKVAREMFETAFYRLTKVNSKKEVVA